MSDIAAKERKSHIWDRHPDDWYVEENWVSERLFQSGALDGCRTVLDPACGFGRIVHSAAKAGLRAAGTDIAPRWRGQPHHGVYAISDFLTAWPVDRHSAVFGRPDAIVSNPPFKHAEAFARLSLERARKAVALILPATWRCGDKRSRWLETTPLAAVLDITPRPSMPPGPVIEAGEEAGGGTKDFSVYVWRHGHEGAYRGGWLRKHGERPVSIGAAA